MLWRPRWWVARRRLATLGWALLLAERHGEWEVVRRSDSAESLAPLAAAPPLVLAAA
jgi:hypothetical protein